MHARQQVDWRGDWSGVGPVAIRKQCGEFRLDCGTFCTGDCRDMWIGVELPCVRGEHIRVRGMASGHRRAGRHIRHES